MNRDATPAIPPHGVLPRNSRRNGWLPRVFCLLAAVFFAGCSAFTSKPTARERETIYSSPNKEEPGFFSPRSGPKTTKEFLKQDMVRLPPQ